MPGQPVPLCVQGSRGFEQAGKHTLSDGSRVNAADRFLVVAGAFVRHRQGVMAERIQNEVAQVPVQFRAENAGNDRRDALALPRFVHGRRPPFQGLQRLEPDLERQRLAPHGGVVGQYAAAPVRHLPQGIVESGEQYSDLPGYGETAAPRLRPVPLDERLHSWRGIRIRLSK